MTMNVTSSMELGLLEVRTESHIAQRVEDIGEIVREARRDERTRIVNELMSAGEPHAAAIVKAG